MKQVECSLGWRQLWGILDESGRESQVSELSQREGRVRSFVEDPLQ